VNGIGTIVICVSLPLMTMEMQCPRGDGCCGRVSITSHWTLQGRVYVHQETDSHLLRQNGNSAWCICCGKIIVEEWLCCLAGHPIWRYLQLFYLHNKV